MGRAEKGDRVQMLMYGVWASESCLEMYHSGITFSTRTSCTCWDVLGSSLRDDKALILLADLEGLLTSCPLKQNKKPTVREAPKRIWDTTSIVM